MNRIEVKNRVEYFLFRSLSSWLRSKPVESAIGFHRWLGLLWSDWIKVRKNVAMENLQRAFPEKSEKELQRLANRVIFHFSRLATEHIIMPKLINRGIEHSIGSANWDVLECVFRRKKGTVIISGHFGNWELLGAAVSLKGYPTWAVAAEQRNKKVDRLINAHRHLAGLKIIVREQAKETIRQIFKSGEIIFLISDQDAGINGVFVPFFGQPASTPPGPAIFYLRHGVPLVYATAILKNGKYDVHFEELSISQLPGNFRESVTFITSLHVKRLEQDVRAYPEQWFWLHRRWKTPPPEVVG